MADNIENNYNQRPQRSDSSATGWILGVIIAIAAIAAIWYYGTRDGADVATTNNTTNNTVTTEPPAATTPTAPAETQAPATTTTESGSSTTTTVAGTQLSVSACHSSAQRTISSRWLRFTCASFM